LRPQTHLRAIPYENASWFPSTVQQNTSLAGVNWVELDMPVDGQVAERPMALFVRRGSLSHVNANLLAAMRRVRPDTQFDDLDLAAKMPAFSLGFQRSLFGAIGEFGLGSLRSRHILRYRMLRGLTFFAVSRQIIRQASLAKPYCFTIQTQSLFNAANGVVPNFVYTDNVAFRENPEEWNEGLGRPSEQWMRLEAQIYSDATNVFTFGSRVRRLLISHYGLAPEKAELVGTGANVTPQAPLDTAPERYARQNILFAGVNWERKGGPDLLAAFIELRKRLPSATLTILGCTPAEAQGVPGCEVRGRVGIEELDRFYRAASCLCVPSRQEPFGNVFVEAGHYALPVVATRVGDIGDVVHDGVNGFRVPHSSPGQLEEALYQLLSVPDRARSFGLAGRQVTEAYSWDTVARRVLARAP
jgi:glycosyltransferase involved in cell wall biosynthesis